MLKKKSPEQRAEALLRQFLTPDQIKDWEENRGFNVVGSSGTLYRLNPYAGRFHDRLVSTAGYGYHVWPRGVEEIKADWALGMLLYLTNDDRRVVYVACRDMVYASYYYPKEYEK